MTFYLILHSGWKIFKSPDLLFCFVRLFGWFEIPVFLSNLIPTEKSAGIWNYPKNRSDPSCSNIFCALRNTNSLRISIHLKALSFRVFGLVHEYLRIPDPQSPIPNLRSTILDARCPIPDPRSPIPDPRSPIPDPRSLLFLDAVSLYFRSCVKWLWRCELSPVLVAEGQNRGQMVSVWMIALE